MVEGSFSLGYAFCEPILPMNQIEEDLYLGGLEAAEDKALLQERGITHILSLLNDFRRVEKLEGFEYMQIALPDTPDEDILRHIPQALSFISRSLKQGKILVHCASGMSRSASIVIAYIMIKNGYQFDTAKAFVKSKRSCILPNPGFQQQIASIKYDEYIQYLN